MFKSYYKQFVTLYIYIYIYIKINFLTLLSLTIDSTQVGPRPSAS